MTKKFMAILLIIGLLTVGLAVVSAEDVAEDTSSADTVNDVSATGTGDDTSSEYAVDDSSNDEGGLSDSSNESDDENTTIAGAYADEEGDNTTSTAGAAISDEFYHELTEGIGYNLTQAQYMDLIAQLRATHDEAFNNLADILANPTENIYYNVFEALKELDADHLIGLLRLLNSYEDSDSYYYIAPTQNDVVKTTSSTNNVKGNATTTQTGNSATHSGSHTYKQTPKSNSYIYTYGEALSSYEIYQYFLGLYLEGQLNYDELRIILESYGINTDTMKQNEDGSITFMGETSSVPVMSQEDALDKMMSEDKNDINGADTVDDTSATDNSADADSTSNTASDESAGDGETASGRDSTAESTSGGTDGEQ